LKKQNIFKRKIPVFLIFLFLLNAASITEAKSNKSILSYVKKQQNKGALWRASWSVYAEYVDGGKTIISWNSNKNLIPASGMKLFTTAAALHILGEDFRFSTKIYYDGEINGQKTLKGNIYIVGGGDPTMASTLMKDMPDIDSVMNHFASKIRKIGIKKVNGAIIADDFLFDGNPLPDNWVWNDIGNYYGARSSALSIHDNLYFLRLKAGKFIGDNVTILEIEPKISNLTFNNHLKTAKRGSGDQAYIYCAPEQYKARLEGTIPFGASKFTIKGAMPDPALFFVNHLTTYLSRTGIVITHKAQKSTEKRSYNNSHLLGKIDSPPLSEIVYWINKRSINLFAEQLLKMISVQKGGDGNIKNAVNIIEEFLEDMGINIDGFQMDDGSGLSRTNTISTKMMVKLLSKMTHQPTFRSYYNSFSVAGNKNDDGVYKYFGKGTILQNNARLKSGTLYRIRSHSGYLKDKNGRLIAFSMIANNYDGSLNRIEKVHKKIMMMLAALK
jgi:D-alanyl-D-alanine carboxypeptidase/D-alanyl-D-alanine-endopeptidase (penicillin-binding protein 4)